MNDATVARKQLDQSTQPLGVGTGKRPVVVAHAWFFFRQYIVSVLHNPSQRCVFKWFMNSIVE